jgi:hypothetical protein
MVVTYTYELPLPFFADSICQPEPQLDHRRIFIAEAKEFKQLLPTFHPPDSSRLLLGLLTRYA